MIPAVSADFACQMEQVLDVYERPYDAAHPVVCLDESPRQLIREVRPGFVDAHGVTYEDYEYSRQGVADLYMIVEPKAGRRQVLVKENHNRLSYAEVLLHIAEKMYADAERITLVEDNLSAHKPSALYEIVSPDRARRIVERLEVVRTPTHGSWLNVAELELSVLSRQGLPRRVGTVEELGQQVRAWYGKRNDRGARVDWQFTTADARLNDYRLKVGRFDGP